MRLLDSPTANQPKLRHRPILTADPSIGAVLDPQVFSNLHGDLTNFYNANYHFLTRRTMVFSLGPSILNPVVQAVGPVLLSGGASAHSQ